MSPPGKLQMNLEFASLSHIGQVRQKNEDAVGQFEPSDEAQRSAKGQIFVVADGMGGHRGGDIASKLAVETIIDTYYAAPDANPVHALDAAFSEANKAILSKSMADVALFGMGTTCTALLVLNGNGYFAHVGDSRAYLLRDGALRQVTEDHSLVGEMVKSGMLSDEDAQHHPKRNVITRSLGTNEDLTTDFPETLKFETGDTVLLCSDGLTSMVTDVQIRDILAANSPSDACQALVDLANENGGKDNVSVQIVKAA